MYLMEGKVRNDKSRDARNYRSWNLLSLLLKNNHLWIPINSQPSMKIWMQVMPKILFQGIPPYPSKFVVEPINTKRWALFFFQWKPSNSIFDRLSQKICVTDRQSTEKQQTITPVQMLVRIDSVGASPQMGELFSLSCPVFFLGHAPTSNRWTNFHALWLKRRVSEQEWSFLRSGR